MTETKTVNSESVSYVRKERIIAYIFDLEDELMYPIIDTGNIERHARELPHLRNHPKDCQVIPAQPGDYLCFLRNGDSIIIHRKE